MIEVLPDEAFYTVCMGLGRIRISGPSASAFVHTMTTVDTQDLDPVGAAAPSLILTGQAEVIDIVMIVRSGDTEFMLTTSSSTADEVFDWLEAHAALSDEEGPVFPNLELTDETDSLTTIAVYGPASSRIVNDLAAGSLEVALGSMQSALCQLDGIPAFVFSYPLLDDGYFELSVAPSLAIHLEHLLLSFPEINPESFEEFRMRRQAARTWFDGADEAAYRQPNTPQLTALLRDRHDFVGGRALGSTD